MMSLPRRILNVRYLYYTPEPNCSILRCEIDPPLLAPPLLSPPFIFPSPPPPPTQIASIHKNVLANHALLASAILVAFFLLSILSSVFFLFFHRRFRRRRAAQAIQVPTPSFDAGLDPTDDPIHHVWYIRTVGLDEATIESIAATEYRSDTELLGAADCAVCLGDFRDGDLVRLLPKCGHAFHVPCIDTWLRAHVNCPLCRAHVVDPMVAAEAMSSIEGVIEGQDSDTGSESRESSTTEMSSVLQNEHAQEVFDEIPLDDSPPEVPVERASEERESRPVRYRSGSLDSPFVPEIGTGTSTGRGGEIGKGREKLMIQTGHSEMERSFSSSSSNNRVFFFSRNGRSRSSVLPL